MKGCVQMTLEARESTEVTFAKNWIAREEAEANKGATGDEGPRMERWRGVDLDMDEIEGVQRKQQQPDDTAEAASASAPEPPPAPETPAEAARNATVAALDALLPAPPPPPPEPPRRERARSATESGTSSGGATTPPAEIKEVVVRDVLKSSNATLRITIVITFAVGLGILTWAGTVARLADSGLSL